MMKISSLIFLLIGISFIQSCSSYQVKPVSEEITWKNGKGYVKTQNENIVLQVALDYVGLDNLRFAVEIENTSAKDLLIDPGTFFITGESLNGKSIAVNNPEAEIGDLNRQIEGKKSIAETSGTDVVVGVLGLATTIAGEKSADREERLKREQKREKEQTDAKTDILYLEKQKNDLEAVSLRKSTLVSKAKMSGMINFPNELAAGSLNIVLKNAGSDLVVPFQVIRN